MPRSRSLRVLIVVAVVVVLGLVAVVAMGVTVVRRPLPDHSGSAALPGLHAEVTVLRDARGVPTIYADTPEDLFAAQGYVHAQDRFFEMDYRRHVTSGRLSELVGENEDALKADKVIRTFGWRHVAEQEWDLLDPDTRSYLQAYADGVNAYLHSRSTDTLAVEYTVLGLKLDTPKPEDWDPIDSLAWLKAMAWDLRGNYDDELDRGLAYATLHDVDRVEDLFPAYPTDHEPIVEPTGDKTSLLSAPSSSSVPQLSPELTSALATVRDALNAVPHLIGQGDGIGSNSWAVSGTLTTTGKPILANDPHLSISAPGVWSQMGLHCTDVGPKCPFDVSGFTFSGFPGVIIGHNANLAWGLTNMGADVTDFFLERVDDDAGTYLRDGAQVPLETRTEKILVNGGDPVTLEVRSTAHGPIVSDVLEVGALGTSPTRQGTRAGTEVALQWTALQPGRTADAVFQLDLAKDAADVAAAAAVFEVPAQNIVYATTDGHIGYQAPGRIPVRGVVPDGPVPSDGTWPRPGWDSRYDWQGWVPAAEMPAMQDPPQGYIVAANQAVTAPGTPGPFLTSDWDYGFRSDRIRDLLDKAVADGRKLDVAAMNAIQNDAWSPFAAALVPSLVTVGTPDAFTEEAIDLLRHWDFQQSEDSAAAAYFAAVWAKILNLTFHDDLPETMWPDGGSQWLEVVLKLMERPDSPWWDDRRTVSVVESRDEILVRAMEEARLDLTVQLGKDATSWRWGQLHRAAPEHPVLGGDSLPALVRRLVNPAPLGVDGGSSIVNATAWDAGSGSYAVTAAPSMRMVVDLGDLDASTWVTLTGTSGHPGSVHYTDQFEAWADGRTYPWPFTRGAVDDATDQTMVLAPAKDD